MSADQASTERIDDGADPDVETYLHHLEQGHADRAIELALDQVREGRTVTVVIEHLLAPAQRLVGHRWQQGRYTVAQEHFASGVTEDVLGLLVTHTAAPTTPHTVALVCAEGEWHTTPARMASLRMRDAGWRVQFLGGSMPAEHLTTSLRAMPPQAIAISCTIPLALDGVPSLVDAAAQLHLPVLAGGIGFGPDDRRARHLGVHGYAGDPTTAATTLTAWLDQPPEALAPVADPERAHERTILAVARPELVDATYEALTDRVEGMAGYTERQRRHTRRDLDYILRFAETALLVADARVFTDFVAWLDELLVVRGVPEGVLDRSLATLVEQLPEELTHTRTVLGEGRARVTLGRPARAAG